MKKLIISMAAAAAVVSLSAENRIANSSFEAGDTGFSTVQYQVRGKESAKTYLPVWTKGDAPHGEYFLKFPETNGERVQFMSPEITLSEKERTYTVSAWLKSEKPTNVRLGFFQVTHCLPKVSNSWYGNGRDFKVGPEWKRYSATFKIPKEHQYGFVTVGWSNGSVSVDGIQFEAGKKVPNMRRSLQWRSRWRNRPPSHRSAKRRFFCADSIICRKALRQKGI